jgi:hypothetical protein
MHCNFCGASYDECHPTLSEYFRITAMAAASDPVAIVSVARTPLGRKAP